MDIKNIFENFTSSVSNPNIVEHFDTHEQQQQEEENQDMYDDFIDKLVKDPNLSKSEKNSLLRIKERGEDKKELLFNYLIGIYNIYTNNVQTVHVKKVALNARKGEQAERIKEISSDYTKSQGSNETIKREIQVNNYKYESANYDIDVLKIVLIGIGVLTVIPIVGFFKVISKKVAIILWVLTILGLSGYGGYAYFLKTQRDINDFDKIQFDKPSKNQVSGHTTDPEYESSLDPKKANVGKIDKYINETECPSNGNGGNGGKGGSDDSDHSPIDVTTQSTRSIPSEVHTPTTQVFLTKPAQKPVCRGKPKISGKETIDSNDNDSKLDTSGVSEMLNDLVENIKDNKNVSIAALICIFVVIFLGVFLYKRQSTGTVQPAVAIPQVQPQLQQPSQPQF